MNSFRISWVVGVAALYVAASAQFETWQQRASRESSERMWAEVREQQRQQIEAFNTEIAAARADFWAKYPDKPGVIEARDKFFDLLDDKDIFYLNSALSGGITTAGDIGDSLDGGIRQTAKPEYDDLVKACRPGFRGQGDIKQFMQTISRSIAAHPDELAVYRRERNWWEFDQAHRIPSQWDKPEVYAVYLYYRYYHNSREIAEASNARMIELLGKDVVLSAARKVMEAPKTDRGGLIVTAPRPVKRGPGGSELEDYSVPMPAEVIGTWASPLTALLLLATKDDDRHYLIYLLAQQHQIDSTKMDHEHQWEFAGTTYRRLVAGFGEKDVLEASRKVRTATKRMVDGSIMDQAAIGARRNDPFLAFQDILAKKNPRGYLRSAVAFNQSLDSPASIDDSYRKLVADGGEEAYLTAARRRAKDNPNVIYPLEITRIKDLLNAPEVVQVVEEMADYDEYLNWKRFPAGAKVTYIEHKWMASRPRPGQFVSDDPTRLVSWPADYIHSYLLKSIDDKQAALWFTETNANQYGQLGQPRDREIAYPSKIRRSVAERNAQQRRAANPDDAPAPETNLAWGAKRTADPVQSGEEVLEVNGTRFATKWRSATYRVEDWADEQGIRITVKVWTSDALPTGLIRRTEDKTVEHIPGQVQPARYIVEKYLESFDGFTPPPVTASGPVMTAYTPPPLPASATAAAPTPPKPTVAANTTMPVQPASPATTPAKPTVAPPPPKPAGIDTSKISPEAARQMELNQRYSAAVTRASRDRAQLLQWQQQHGASGVPADVQAAQNNILTQMQGAALAMGSQDKAKFDQSLRDLDASTTTIEKFLAH